MRPVYAAIAAGAFMLGALGSDAPIGVAYDQPIVQERSRTAYPGVEPDASYCYSSLVTASFASLQDRSSWGREYAVADVPPWLRSRVESILDTDGDGIITEAEACDAMGAVAEVAMREKQGFRAWDALRAYGDEQ